MSKTDKTGEQLISSIRKTKAGPETAAAQSAKRVTTSAKAPKPKPATRAPSKKTLPAKQKNSETLKQVDTGNKTTASGQSDPYQSGSRVWPD